MKPHPRLPLTPIAGLGLAILLTSACAPEPTPDHDHHHAALDFTSGPQHLCVDPPQNEIPDIADQLALPTTGVQLGQALEPSGLQVAFATGPAGERPGTLTVRVPLEEADPDGRLAVLDGTYAGVAVRVQTAPDGTTGATGSTGRGTATQGGTAGGGTSSGGTAGGATAPAPAVVLSTGGLPLNRFELEIVYATRASRSGVTEIGATGFALLDKTSGAQAAHQSGPGSYAPTPSSCLEEGILRFGAFPAGLPALKWPSFQGCSWSKCSDIAFGWLKVHHNVWRANQLFAVLDGMHPAQRHYFWGRPGRDAQGDDVSLRSSPEYWYGDFDADRYAAIREVMHDFSTITTTAKTGAIKVRMVCPDQGSNPGNVCFNSSALGHHFVKGWINVCDVAFNGGSCNSDGDPNAVARVLHHEPLHHVFTHLNGLKALRDTHTHFHGNACLSTPKTGPVYCEEGNGSFDVRHFVLHGEGCGHLDKLAQTLDAHALFIKTVGDMVDAGEMTHWPAITPQTPDAPSCYSDPGCLCDPTDAWTPPDGDHAIDQQCPDNQGLATCQRTTFNASDTVGICTLCDEHRGAGCPCNDLSQPCDEGFCWGDDTHGNASATGTCYDATPPAWGCLADCDDLLGAGAFCMHDHPDGARCVPQGTATNEAHNCWIGGGHMDPQELSCTFGPECVQTADCHALGYPGYFVCDGTNRCVVP